MIFTGQEIIDNLFFHFKGNSSVQIFFENKSALNSDSTAINLSIHPIRFCDDIFFNFETNDQLIFQKIKSHEVDYKVFYHYADCIKSQMARRTQNLSMPENSALIVGQLIEDKSVFDGSKYLNLIDFSDQINKMSDTYESIYLRLHPYLNNKRLFFKKLKKRCPKIKIIKENIYTLLSHPSITTVAALNSSVLHEANYFNKQVVSFFKPQFDFKGNDIGVFGDYFSSKFWANILDIEDTGVSLPVNENRLRRIFGDYWSYPELSTSIDLKAVLKSKVRRYISLNTQWW